MAASDYYTRGRAYLTERPLTVLLVVAVVALLLDVVRKLANGSLPVANLLTFFWNGILLGLAIGLAGIGLSMTYSILSFANFSHGDLMTSGAFAGWATTYILAGIGQFPLGQLVLIGGPAGINISKLGISVTTSPLAIIVGLLVSAGATAVLAVVIDRVVYKPMRDQEGISLLIASVGVALVLRYLIVFFFQATNRGLTSGSLIASATIPVGAKGSGINVDAHEVTLLISAVVLLLAMHLMLQRTKLGKAMRAMADNEDLAKITGIRTERVVTATWVLGGALTGASGFLIALEQGTLDAGLGWTLLLLIFAAVILGGIGSIYGAVFGGLVIGVASRLSLIWLPSNFLKAAAFAVMVVVLLVRPSGLFKGVTTA